MMIEMEMAAVGGIPSLPQMVFESREWGVLFVLWQRLALHSSQIHYKSRTNLVR